jgi:phosphoribosylamine-glycine ligase
MQRYNIPTAEHGAFNNFEDGKAYLETCDFRVVIKADGLAAGKGVVLPASKEEAYQALSDMMISGKFGPAGQSVVIEEYLDGDEISLLTFSDGKTWKSLPLGQDHKRVFDGNAGPNTGGMGVYAPVSFVSDEQMAEIEDVILRRTFEGLKSDGELILRFILRANLNYANMNGLYALTRPNFLWYAIHWHKNVTDRPESSRIQRSFWRSGNADIDVTAGERPCHSASGLYPRKIA